MSSRLHYFGKFAFPLHCRAHDAIFLIHTTINRKNMCFILLTSASSFYVCSLLSTSTRSECFHIKHAPLRVITSQLNILVCYKSLP